MKMKRTYLNVWDTVKAMLTGKSLAINAYIKNKKCPMTNGTLQFKGLEEEWTKPKAIRMKEIKIWAEIESRKTHAINDTKCWFFRKSNKVDNLAPHKVKIKI